MPLYDFGCPACGERYEAQAAVGELAPCPACGATEVQRQYGPVGTIRLGLRGLEARRSDATRRNREEARRERREIRRAERGPRGQS